MTLEEIMKLVLFFLTVAGSGWAIWWKIDAKVDKVKAEAMSSADDAQREADQTARDLAAYKLHVAESYVTKSGMKEIKDEILGAVSGIRDDVRHLGTRIDAMHEANNKPRPRRAAGD